LNIIHLQTRLLVYTKNQLSLFGDQNLNIVAEVKRQIRMALAKTTMSRDQIVDQMNALAARDGLRETMTKATLDGWCKDSDASRMPSIVRLVLFCHVLGTIEPFRAVTRPLGCDVVGPEEKAVLRWGKAELEKRRAAKRARLALENLETEDGKQVL
jgi:hypothetical protein